MINTKKTTQDVLQDEMLRERVANLARAGEKLAEALEKLHEMESEIAAEMVACQDGDRAGTAAPHVGEVSDGPATRGMGAGECNGRQRFLYELNGKIQSYNRQRENAQTRYYYLIVTREALGIIHHQRLEEIYRIPPKKHCLSEG